MSIELVTFFSLSLNAIFVASTWFLYQRYRWYQNECTMLDGKKTKYYNLIRELRGITREEIADNDGLV